MLSVLAAILMQAAAPAVGPGASAAGAISQPSWAKLPNADDLAKFYPPGAAAARLEGRVTIRCTVTSRGDLIDCQIASEDPAGQGFGDAALSLASKFRMLPKTKDGASVAGGQINIPIRFQPSGVLAEGEPPRPESGALRYYPEQAQKDRVEGSATIHCKVTKEGKLSDCTVVAEEPQGAGFGEAALKMSPLFAMKPARRDGAPVDGEINIPIRFRLPN